MVYVFRICPIWSHILIYDTQKVNRLKGLQQKDLQIEKKQNKRNKCFVRSMDVKLSAL